MFRRSFSAFISILGPNLTFLLMKIGRKLYIYKDTLLTTRFLTTEMDKQPLRHILNTQIQQRQVCHSQLKSTPICWMVSHEHLYLKEIRDYYWKTVGPAFYLVILHNDVFWLFSFESAILGGTFTF